MLSRDTTPAAAQAQLDTYRTLTGAQRVAVAFELSMQVREVVRSGIAHRHPEYDEETIELALYRVLYGDRMFLAVWPDKPLVAP